MTQRTPEQLFIIKQELLLSCKTTIPQKLILINCRSPKRLNRLIKKINKTIN